VDCHARKRVPIEGGAIRADVVATWALVRIRGKVLGGVAASRSRTAHRFRRCSRLVALVGLVLGALLLLGIFGIGVCVRVEHMILLLSSLWGVGTLMGVCTLRTHCMVGEAGGVAVSLKRLGCVCMCARVKSMIC